MWMESLHANDWTLDPAIFNFEIGYLPPDYCTGYVASSWEFTDPNTYVCHIRQGVRWQNIAPVNGREFTADDVVWHYHRLFGGGDGFTKVDPFYSSVVQFQDLISISAPDKYTVIFKWKTPNVVAITGALQNPSIQNEFEAKEAVALWGDVNDWHHQIGTGAFILTDFVSDSAVTLAKNTTYWGYDERYPKNKLPYIDKVTALVMPDNATALAAMRTGKIDVLDQVSLTNAQGMKKTNPEIVQINIPLGTEYTVDPRNDVKPFNDIKVRIALQKAINIPEIAKTYYQGQASNLPATLTAYEMTGWTWQYADWPQSLKDEYSYDPVASKKMLADAGYPSGFKTDIYAATDFDLDLLQIVKGYFAAVGVDMEIRALDPTTWLSFVYTSKKHDAFAVRNQGFLAINYEPIVQIYRFMTNYRVNYINVSDPDYDALIPRALATTSLDAFKQVMIDANKLVAQRHYVISVCQPYLFCLYQPWLKGFSGQSNSVQGISSSMLFFFQYGARFWVDSKVKASLGH
jgi:peptide/nickel transport system substrate-binding protein